MEQPLDVAIAILKEDVKKIKSELAECRATHGQVLVMQNDISNIKEDVRNIKSTLQRLTFVFISAIVAGIVGFVFSLMRGIN